MTMKPTSESITPVQMPLSVAASDLAARGFEYRGIHFDRLYAVILSRRNETDQGLEWLLVPFDVALALPDDALAPPRLGRQIADVKEQIRWHQAEAERLGEHNQQSVQLSLEMV